MSKRGVKNKKLFSNRVLYSFIALGIILIISGFVYAVAGAKPDPGHLLSELQPCSNGETLIVSGGVWTCNTGSSSQWTTSGNNVYYNTGKVGIGTATPGYTLEVNGQIHTSAVNSGNIGSTAYDLAGNHIGAGNSIYSYGKICAGNSAYDCSGSGGTVIDPNGISTGSIVSTGISSTGSILSTGIFSTGSIAVDYYIAYNAANNQQGPIIINSACDINKDWGVIRKCSGSISGTSIWAICSCEAWGGQQRWKSLTIGNY